jgi:hypothetical protein
MFSTVNSTGHSAQLTGVFIPISVLRVAWSEWFILFERLLSCLLYAHRPFDITGYCVYEGRWAKWTLNV